jgi:hypothetical protein
MKKSLAVFALISCLIPAGSLAASEAVWEVHVMTGLPGSNFILPDPLPKPGPMLLLSDDVLAPPAARLEIPIVVPSLRAQVRSGKAFFDANLVLMVGLNIADYISTREALKYPGLAETNPLMKPFVKSPVAFAAVKAGTTVLTYWSMKSIFKRNRTVAWVMTTASNVLLSYVVANNVRLIQGARAR